MKWTSIKSLASSRTVKLSYIWLIIVPLCAKALGAIDNVINLTFFGAEIAVVTMLPFSWQLLFLAAISFTIANIIYGIYCPDIVKDYDNYSEFEAHGKSRMQINTALKMVVWDNNKPGVKPAYIETLSSYLKYYKDGLERDEQSLDVDTMVLLNDVENQIGKNSNAFYFVHNISDLYNNKQIEISSCLYYLGLGLMGVIVVENLFYVAGITFQS